MEPECSLSWLKEPAIGSYPVPETV